MLALLIASVMNLDIRHPRMHAISSNIGEVSILIGTTRTLEIQNEIRGTFPPYIDSRM